MMKPFLGALLLALPSPSQQTPEKVRALVVTGANNHDWKWTAPQICAALQETGRFDVALTQNPEADLQRAAELHTAGQLDLIVLDYNGPRWGEPAERAFLAAVEAGCGVSVVHAANNAFSGWDEYERLVGLLWRRGTGHGRYHPFDVHVVDHHHPITTGLADLQAHPDELYHRLVHKEGARYRVLMSAYSDPKTGGTGRHEPMVTAGAYGAGRVFHTPLGHVWRNNVPSRATWADPQLRLLLARGSEWAATGVVTLGATPLNRVSKAEADEGFVALFDGKEIAEWTAFRSDEKPAKGWVVRDAAIVHEKAGGGGDLVSREVYGDFDFRFSFRVAKGANSGVMWHVTEAGQQTYFTGPEYQVLDDGALDPSDSHSVGALYDLVGPSGKTARPHGAWNEGRIVVHKGRLRHYLNGAKVVDCPCAGPEWQQMVAKSKFRDWPFGKAQRGRLALQDHGDEVAFRNLRVKKL
ncbi:MAG: family 16 glycoside hydrolase [Planctomycetota bacterium]|nr:family 16 glycoside hydrolase [Planctomycetota bacterium]